MKENLMIIFGGESVEHDISVITALQIMRYVPKSYNVVPVYVEKNGNWCVAENLCEVDTFIDFEKNVKKKRDVLLRCDDDNLYIKKAFAFKPYAKIGAVLMCLHGGDGENGNIAGLLSMCKIPFTSSNHCSSAICMDKIFTKDILSKHDIKNVPYFFISNRDNEKDILKKIKSLSFPVIVKPANLGSSVAIGIAKNLEQFWEQVKVAFMYDERVLVEKFLGGADEYNCGCFYGDEKLFTSKVTKVEKGEFFTFEEKYLEKDVKTPQKTQKNIEKQIKQLTKHIYNLLNCDGVVRIDYLVFEDELYVNEINTIPGSLALHLFSGVSKKEIIEFLIKNAKEKNEQKKRLNFSFESEALKMYKEASKTSKRK